MLNTVNQNWGCCPCQQQQQQQHDIKTLINFIWQEIGENRANQNILCFCVLGTKIVLKLQLLFLIKTN